MSHERRDDVNGYSSDRSGSGSAAPGRSGPRPPQPQREAHENRRSYLDFDMDGLPGNLRQVNPAASVLRVRTRTGQGVAAWPSWLRDVAS